MNDTRRKAIREIRSRLETIKSDLETLKADITQAKDDEQEYFDNMPEAFQSGDKGVAAEAAVDALGNAEDELDAFDLQEIIDHLETAAA